MRRISCCSQSEPLLRAVSIWGAVAVAVALPIFLAAASPYLQFRQPVYIAAGFAGIVAMALLLVQPLLAGGYLPGLASPRGRRVHRWAGMLLVLAVVVHVAGLWLTSPPDVIDALTFTSPTPFSAWGVVAMWALFGAALLAVLRRRAGLRRFRLGHSALVTVTVSGSVVHAMLIEGTMETVSKAALGALAVLVLVRTLAGLRLWRLGARRRM